MTERDSAATLLSLDPERMQRASGLALVKIARYATPRPPRAAECPPSRTPDLRPVEGSVLILQKAVAVGALLDTAVALGCESLEDVARQASEIGMRASRFMGFDVVVAIRAWLGGARPSTTSAVSLRELITQLSPFLRSMAAICPVAHLERLASTAGRQDLGFQCRTLVESIEALLRRWDPALDKRLELVGRAYSEGRLGVSEAADLLQQPIPNMVAFLETHSHVRSGELVGLSETRRSEILARARADRLRRRGNAEESAEFVARSTIASSRIGGIDSRSWTMPNKD